MNGDRLTAKLIREMKILHKQNLGRTCKIWTTIGPFKIASAAIVDRLLIAQCLESKAQLSIDPTSIIAYSFSNVSAEKFKEAIGAVNNNSGDDE